MNVLTYRFFRKKLFFSRKLDILRRSSSFEICLLLPKYSYLLHFCCICIKRGYEGKKGICIKPEPSTLKIFIRVHILTIVANFLDEIPN